MNEIKNKQANKQNPPGWCMLKHPVKDPGDTEVILLCGRLKISYILSVGSMLPTHEFL